MFETPGAANVTLETLSKVAAAFKCGLIIDFVPFSEMLRWENHYSQDSFNVTRIDEDAEFTGSDAESHTISILLVAANLNQTSNVSASVTTVRAGEIAMAPPIKAEIAEAPQLQAAAADGR